MKGIICVTSPTNFFKGEEVDIPSHRPPKEFELTGKQGEKLKVAVSYSASHGILSCFIDSEGKITKNTIAFWFLKTPGPRETLKRRGQYVGTGKFVPWMCSFQHTGD